MNIENLLVTAESVQTGERLTGFVCGCKSCRTTYEDETYDKSRPIGLLTHPNELYGNVRVYTDTMEFVDESEAKALMHKSNAQENSKNELSEEDILENLQYQEMTDQLETNNYSTPL